MSLRKVVDWLTTSPREFGELSGDPELDLQKHAEAGMNHQYGEIGSKDRDEEWDEIQRLMKQSPGVFKTSEGDSNYNGGLTSIMNRPGCTNTVGQTYDVNGNTYSVFLIEVAEPISRDEDPFYIVGEAFEFKDEEFEEKMNYLQAEMRDYDTPLSKKIERY